MTQKSSANPGWRGKGIPTLRDLIIRRGAQTARLIIRRRFRGALNLIRITAADFWNFHGPGRAYKHATCPCCGWRGSAFIATANWRTVSFQSRCPNCDSRSRHRALSKWLPIVLRRKSEGKILFFAPEGILLRQIERDGLKDSVVTTDLFSTDVDYPGEDIQRLTFKTGQFAFIICNHVLEHVRDDRAAIAECARVLCPGGVALFTVPGDFPDQDTREFQGPDSNGHVRHYGMDILQRMSPYFSVVESILISQSTDPAWKVRDNEYAFVCTK